MLNLYLITRTDKVGYDEYSACVVAAANTTEARETHPSPNYNPTNTAFVDGWAAPEELIVVLLGAAIPDTTPGVILASFNAG